MKTGLRALIVVGMIVIAPAVSLAQPAPTDADLTLHPGDRITWTTVAPHRLQFGGANVTSFADVQKVLKDIDPPLLVDDQGIAKGRPNSTVTATVRDDAATSGVATLNFTCGAHPALMVTKPFTFAADRQSRDVQIVSAPPPTWILKTDHGDTKLGGQ